MAMIPFCGYNMADYFTHWLGMEPHLATRPKIFRVNWFRKDDDGKFLWPGYGENVRVLKWIVDRIHGTAKPVWTPIGHIPAAGALDVDGLDVSPARLDTALAVDGDEWRHALEELGTFYDQFGARMPGAIRRLHDRTIGRLAGR